MHSSLFAILLLLAPVTGESVDDVLASYAKGWQSRRTEEGPVIEFAGTIVTSDFTWNDKQLSTFRGIIPDKGMWKLDFMHTEWGGTQRQWSINAKHGIDTFESPGTGEIQLDPTAIAEIEQNGGWFFGKLAAAFPVLFEHYRSMFQLILDGPSLLEKSDGLGVTFANERIALLSVPAGSWRLGDDFDVYAVMIDRTRHCPRMIWARGPKGQDRVVVTIHSCDFRQRWRSNDMQKESTNPTDH